MGKTTDRITTCDRCGMKVKLGPPGNPNAKIIRRAKVPKGLCINCAVHDWLRNTYPVNVLLAESGPRPLVVPHFRTMFAGLLRAAHADAKIDEINWNLIAENWELPFPQKVKPSPMNPCSQRNLDEIAAGTRPGIGRYTPAQGKTLDDLTKPITSFEELNGLEPGLGDSLREALHKQLGTPISVEVEPGQVTVRIGDRPRPRRDDDRPPKQKTLF